MRSLIVTLSTLLLCLGIVPAKAEIAKNGVIQRVLVIHSQAPTHPWIEPFDKALKGALLNASQPTSMYPEYMDLSRFPGPRQTANFMTYIEEKYRQLPPDIVVLNGAQAAALALAIRARIAPGKPIIVVSVKSVVPAAVLQSENVFLADSPFEVAENFRLIKQLRPETRQLVIAGYLPHPDAEVILNEAIENTGRKTFAEVVREPSKSMDSVRESLAKLPPDSAVLLFGFLNDASGAVIDSGSIGKQLSEISPVPTFSLFDSVFGTGVVGGKMSSGVAQGEVAANMIERLLAASSINVLPKQSAVPGRYLFDYAALSRFGLHTRPLPAGHHVINRPPSLYETNPPAVIAGLTAIVLLAVLLITLATILSMRQKAARTMAELNHELEARVTQRSSELQQAMEQLLQSEKLASLGSLVAGIAHELNTPLGNANMVTTTLHARCQEFGETIQGSNLTRSYLNEFATHAKEACDLIERNVNRAAELVTSFKQVAVDQTSERRRSFDLGQLIRETLHTLSPSLSRAPVSISTELAPGLMLDSHPGALAQVITNLITNAVIHARGDRAHLHIAVSAQAGERADMVRLSVSDDGVGMSDEIRKRIFDPFFTTRLGQGGSGLGLYLVHNLVSATLGGRLEVESTPGQGSRFDIELPRVGPNSAAD